ncbi:MAG TPA: hypothetical protein VKY19_23725 [Ktedonosporobacter sp.]|jgi:hypothetical protein|nr:hypothetical protein [Ktedonosporobacter sp.]
MSSRCRPNRTPRSGKVITPEEIIKTPMPALNRRTLLKAAGSSAAAIAAVGAVSWVPTRAALAMPLAFPDIQFDIGAFVHPAQTIAGIQVDFGVTFTYLAPAKLNRNPTKNDQAVLENALRTIEANYSFSPSGIFTFVAYGLPYFNRLPASLVASRMPRLSSNHNRFVLEEAVPSPTDFGQPGITKATFSVPVKIESNDVLFTLRSDSLVNITEVIAWLQGSSILNNNFVPSPDFDGLFSFGAGRLNFVQPGLPRQLANELSAAGIAPFPTIATEINPASPMWMGFVDQQTDSSAPNGATVTFAGANAGGSVGKLTTANPGDYFDNGSIMHLSHNIDDLTQFYNKDPNKFTGAEPYSERVQYMFRSSTPSGANGLPFPQDPNDQFTNGGGLGAPTGNLATQQQSAFVQNIFTGPNAVLTNFDPATLATGVKQLRVGHEQALQRSSRAADGTPLHIRNDGPGLSSLDVPDGSTQPTLEFMVFVPTAEFFRVMRINSASLDLVQAGQNGGTGTSIPAGVTGSAAEDDGLERFITATRRQNFLIPPRRHRSFPLLELT